MPKRTLTPHLPLLTLLLLVAVGLAARVHFARPDPYPSVDGTFYLTQSRELVLHNRLPFSSFPPGWPLLVSLPLTLAGADDPGQVFRVAQGTNVLLGVLWPVLAFLGLRRELGPWRAVIGAAVLLALPLAIISAKGDLSEMSYGCVLLAALLLLPKDRFLAGLALGGAYLIRPEALLIAGALAAVFAWRERRLPVGLLGGVALWVVPYVLFLHHETGTWALTGKMGFLDTAVAHRQGTAYVGAVLTQAGTLLAVLPRLLGWPLLVTALVGLVARPRMGYLALTALLPLPLFDFAMADRYWLPYLPSLLLAAGLGAPVLLRWARRWRRPVVPVAWLLVCLAGVGLASADDAFWVSRNPNAYYGIREAGEWLRPQVAPGTKIAAYKPFAAFWAGTGFVKVPEQADPAALVDDLRAQGVSLLVISFHEARLLAPQVKPLLQQPLAPELAERVRVLRVFPYTPDDHTTVVFRLLWTPDM